MEAHVLSLWDIVLSIVLMSALVVAIINILDLSKKRLIQTSDEKHDPLQSEDIPSVVNTLKQSYSTNSLRPLFVRKQILYCLYRMLVDNKRSIAKAIQDDLKRDKMMCLTEVESVIVEVKYYLDNIDKKLSPKQVKSASVQLPCKSYVTKEPFGCVCVISPWNFPVNLSLIPVAGALACGNTVFLKMSKYSKNTSRIIAELCDKYVPSEYLRCEYLTGREAIQACCDAPFDYYFFTGSTHVGKIIHQAAANKTVPVTLEMGGKNPAIVDNEVDMKVAAKRIAWTKIVNTGQICVCVDHVFVPKNKKEEFCELVKKYWIEMFGEDPQQNENYGRMITQEATKKMKSLIESGDVYYGGNVDVNDSYVQPTILQNVRTSDDVMKDEIFGPILPVIEYENIDEVIENISKNPNPLACYVYTSNHDTFSKIQERVNSGSLYMNDGIIHLMNHHLPFGGNCQSGIGTYHGKETFRTFSRPRSVCKAHTVIDLPLRYMPYNQFKEYIIEKCSFMTIPVLSYL
ncbi:Aldehyde dehydrogenase 1 [Entamoeba marina]